MSKNWESIHTQLFLHQPNHTIYECRTMLVGYENLGGLYYFDIV